MTYEPRAMTADEVRERFLGHVRTMVQYWATVESPHHQTLEDKLSGLAFSILNIFDGTTMNLPAFDIICSPHPDDAEYCRSEGENWYPEGVCINDDVMLHEMFYQEVRQ